MSGKNAREERIPFTPWYMDPACLAELWRYLAQQGHEPDDVPHFLEKPWHWQPEWDQMQGDALRGRAA